MADKTQMTIKRAKFLLCLTVGLAAGQSIFDELVTTNGAHQILSAFFFIELAILGLTIFSGLKNKWTRILLTLLTFTETVLFFLNRPISPDELPMILIFAIRAYVFVGFFKKKESQYYTSVD
ncbi:hypothetical protein FGF1_08720 [Flavobacteriaceae bacterium GF1]